MVVRALTEGVSVRGTARLTGVSKPTILRLVLDLGRICAEYQDRVLADLPCRRIECDEIWQFVYAKPPNVPAGRRDEFGYGEVWTWVAMDPESKLVVCWLIAPRDPDAANTFIFDLSTRLRNRVQITTDGLLYYREAVEAAFGGQVDFAQLVKDFGTGRRDVWIVEGRPDPVRISTSLIERQNLTMRMQMRRFTRRTNGFSKSLKHHAAMQAIHFMTYNFARPHMGLNGVSPAQAIGLSRRLWKMRDVVGLLETQESSLTTNTTSR